MAYSSYRQWKEVTILDSPCPTDMDWRWDPLEATSDTELTNNLFDAVIHPNGSKGTGAIRGDTPFVRGHIYYWEILVYGDITTLDIIVGVGTKDFDLKSSQNKFCSLIGSDKKSWGYSYTGVKRHDGKTSPYGITCPMFNTLLIGVRLDMWRGTLEYFSNRYPLGVAFENLHKENVLYPMICSTATQSKFKIKYCQSLPVNLQLLCLEVLDPRHDKYLPPGLLRKVEDYWWIPKYVRPLNINKFCRYLNYS